MEWVRRDSPARQEQGPTGHQKGKSQDRGTSRKGTQKKGLEFTPGLQGLCPPCPLRASSLISPLPAATPPTPSSFHCGICGSSLTFRENPTFLSPELSGSTPRHPLQPVSVPDPGCTGSGWLHRRPIHLAAVPGHVRLSHRNALQAVATASLLLSLQNPVQMSSPVNLRPLQRVSHSFLWGPCLHQTALLVVLLATFEQHSGGGHVCLGYCRIPSA